MDRANVYLTVGLLLIALFFPPLSDYLHAELTVDATLEPLTIEVKTDRLIYNLNQRVGVIVYIRNMSEEPLKVVEPAIDKRSLRFEISQPNNKKDKLLDIYGLKLKIITLPPKKRLKFTTTFIPEMKGQYEINVRYYGFEEKALVAAPVNVFVVNKSGP